MARQRMRSLPGIKCLDCGRFISFLDIANGKAIHRLLTPQTSETSEEWESVCEDCWTRGRLKSEKVS
jgi:hypothetical protein